MNSNIRCIEIGVVIGNTGSGKCWIVTLDVLKYNKKIQPGRTAKLNSNIRCIEIIILNFYKTPFYRWIVTLDVLKLSISIY